MFDSEEHASLLESVRAAPDDDAPRLAYADWLAESGRAEHRARAELIRVQLALASEPVDAAALHARELELLAEHGASWLPEHPALQRVRFRRGFIEYAHLHLTHYLHHRRQLRRLAPIRALSLTGWNRCSASLVDRVAGCAELADIESLSIHHQGPHKHPRDEVATLLESPHLSSLVELELPMLEITRATRIRIEQCALLGRLRRLHLTTLYTLLRDTGEWFEDGTGSLQHSSELRHLDLTGGFGTHAKTVSALAQSGAWPRLEGLALDLPSFQSELPSELASVIPSGLTQLTLQQGGGGSDPSLPDELLIAIGARPLESLTLRGLGVSASQLGHCLRGGTIRDLTFDGCGMGQTHVRVLANASLPLQRLALRGCDIPDSAARVLFDSSSLGDVRLLDLADTSISARGLEMLGASPMRALRYLCVELRPENRTALPTMLEGPALRSLVWLRSRDGYRREPALSASLAEALAKLEHLRGFTLPLSELSAPDIERALPKVAWPIVLSCDYESVLDYDDHRPGRWPPIDVAMNRYRASNWM